MFFKKKREMVELGEVQRRNVNLPNGRKFVAKDGMGFVDLTKKSKLPSQMRAEKLSRVNAPSSVFSPIGLSSSSPSPSESGGAFSFFDSPVSSSFSPSSSSGGDSDTNEMLRKISTQISDLDTKLYKMEQRIEVLERKVGVGAGW